MAVSDYSGLAFELILQPSLLSEKLFSKYKNENKRIKADPEIIGVLQEFLQQLSSIPNLSNKIEPGFLSENTQRKRSFIQLMALQIHAFFEWDLDLIQKHLPLNLQSQLLETLLWTCRRSQAVFMAEKDKISSGEPILLTKLEKCSAFAIQLYMRWVLRTFMTLNDPSPPGNKAQLYGSNFSCSGNTLSQEIVMQLNSMRFTAVETLQKFIPSAYSSIPSPQSFRVNSATLETECMNTDWANLDSTLVVRQISFDVSTYHFFIENYAASEKYLRDIEAPINFDGDSSIFEGYKVALSMAGNATESVHEISHERRILSELQAWSSLKNDLGCKLTEENASFRLSQNLPPNFDSLHASTNIWSSQDFKSCIMKALSSRVESNVYADEKIVFNEKATQKQSTKQNSKLKKFELISCLLREKNPDKIYKLVADLHKLNVNVKQIASRWNVEEASRGVLLAAASLVGAGPRAVGPDSDFPTILLAKLRQTRDLRSYLDLQDYLSALSRFINEKGRHDKIKLATFETKMSVQLLYIRMLHFNDRNAPREEKLLNTVYTAQVKESFNVMLATTDSSSPHDRVIMEEIVATLLNLGEYEFILTHGKNLQWKVIELASLISTLALHFRKKIKLTQPEYKQVLQNAETILISVVQGEVTSKRHRDSTSSQISEKKLMLGFISKFRHEDVVDIVKSFYVSCFNSTVTDGNQIIIQNHVFYWPVSTKSSTVNTDALLALLADLTENNQEGYRIRGEIYFAQGNYPAAMKYYLESLVISTNYFIPYKSGMQHTSMEWEKIMQKMIRCSTELNLHLQTAVLCQFLNGESDYLTSFKSLEERNSHDAMDPLYNYMWDVTVLEYLVSMHTKRGEISRKRKALEVISQLDININNNEEILREAKSKRKSAFFRYLCNAFL